MLAGIAGSASTSQAGVPRVDSAAALRAALVAEPSAPQIYLQPGVYSIDRTITVPDGTTLIGAGHMRYDDGLPVGFESGTETILEPAPGFTGDLLLLGHHSGLRGLVLRGAARNVVIASRTPNDLIEATIVECEIVNSHAAWFDDAGPLGYGIVVFTRNPGPAHEGARLNVTIETTIVRTPLNTGALFAINFAARGSIALTLRGNRFEGALVGSAGTNRAAFVDRARLEIESSHNLYAPIGGAGTYGWYLCGGSSSPHFTSDAPLGPQFNELRMRSAGDRIEGASVGILAAAARRFPATSGLVSDNSVDLDLENLTIRTVGPDAADVQLLATVAEPPGNVTVGERNVLRASMKSVSGSSRRANLYEGDANNRLEVAGSPESFARTNAAIDPAPPAASFVDMR